MFVGGSRHALDELHGVVDRQHLTLMVVREAGQVVRDEVDASPIDEGAVRGHGDEHRPAAVVRHADDGSVGDLRSHVTGRWERGLPNGGSHLTAD